MATLAYYDALGWPLTLVELEQRLIPLSRVGISRDAASVPLSLFVRRCEALRQEGVIRSRHGFFGLAAQPDVFFDRRIDCEKECAQKWRRMLRRAWWLQAVPYVRVLAAGGSLALGNTARQSDWDMFVIARAGHLYTARLGLLAAAWLLGALRTKRDVTAPDKFCFNHSVTTDGLALRHRSIFVAHALAVLIPAYDPQHYLERLWQANRWTADAVTRTGGIAYIRRSVRPSPMLAGVRRAIELVLDTPLGTLTERILRAWQQRRIRRDPATHERGGRVVADTRELEFHPRSFEAVALRRYNATLARYGFQRYAEADSGLTR